MTGRECCHERLWEIILPPAGRRRCPLREQPPALLCRPPAANALLLLPTRFWSVSREDAGPYIHTPDQVRQGLARVVSGGVCGVCVRCAVWGWGGDNGAPG